MSAGRALLGLLLVAGGLFWLAVSGGWLHPDWEAVHLVAARVLAWWPLLLVAVGLGILLTRRTGLWLGLLALVGLVLVGLWAVSAAFVPWTWFDEPGRHVARVARPDAAIEAARLKIDTTVASLVLSEGAPNDALAVVESSLAGVAPRVVTGEGNPAVVRVDSAAPLAGAVRLDGRLPWEVAIDGAAVQARLDLDQTVLAGLEVHAASARLEGSIGEVVDSARIVVDAAVADTRLEVPAGVGVEVRVRGASGRLHLPGFVAAGEVWRSANWEDAQVRVLVDHRAALYRLSIHLRS